MVRVRLGCRLVGALAVAAFAPATQEAPEPFPVLFGYCSDCLPSRTSPDPLVRYTWRHDVNETLLQIYRVDRPALFSVVPAGAISGAESLSRNTSGLLKLKVKGEGSLCLDWGVERAAWLEIESPDLHEQSNVTLQAAVSEFNSPYPGKTQTLTRYGTTTYRLELNRELYEGVRFAWLYFDAPDKPWHITKISLVAKVKPVAYKGSFDSSTVGLTRIWYTGAYGVRLNMEGDAFNSILIERGDRVSIQGDGHPTMAAALVSFAPFQLVKDMVDQTNSGSVHGHHVVDDGIMAYPIYWTMSVNDWFLASGDVTGFARLAPDAMSIVDKRVKDFLQPDLDIGWMGWDDRLGNGWCYHGNNDTCTREALLAFAGLVVRACRDLSRSLKYVPGMEMESKKYKLLGDTLARRFRQVIEFPGKFGLHAAANAINAGVVTKYDATVLFKNALSDSVNICSLSPFNQYWILQALGNADKMEYAIASIKLCWEPMTTLGKGCFWELFSPEWAEFMSDGDKAPTMPSYCHPWSSGVTAWLSHVLGGIEPLLPGYSEFVAAPYVSARYPSVSTVVPTPFGSIMVNASIADDVRLSHDIGQSCISVYVNSPTPGFVALRKRILGSAVGMQGCILTPHVLLNGIRTAIKSPGVITGSARNAASLALREHFVPTRASAILLVRIPAAGVHNITAVYRGSCPQRSSQSDSFKTPTNITAGIPHVPPFPRPTYSATTKLDRISKGDGLLTYGTDGYVLFGFDNGTDRRLLPSYIKNVTVRGHGFTGWGYMPRTYVGTSKCNPTYLPDPQWSLGKKVPAIFSTSAEYQCQGKRALGRIDYDEGSGWDPGILLDVEVAELGGRVMRNENIILDVERENGSTSFQMSIYSVAQDEVEKHAIRAMDLRSLNVIAPTGFVSEYKDGVWWTIDYDGSMRLRIMGIDHARISAVAFSHVPTSPRTTTNKAS